MVKYFWTAMICLFMSTFAYAGNTLLFDSILAGGITITGNTLGLSKEFNANGPGTEGSIGTYISLDPMSVDDSPANLSNPWPAYTTWKWMDNGSSAVLTLPVGAEIIDAELVWGGSYNYIEDSSANLDTPVTLTFGEGDPLSVTPTNAATLAEVSFTGYTAYFYSRSADVTTYVTSHGSEAPTKSQMCQLLKMKRLTLLIQRAGHWLQYMQTLHCLLERWFYVWVPTW